MQFHNDRPIYVQIIEKIHEQILNGQLSPEERVPAVRELALQLQVNPNTVVKSFTELEQSGVIYKKRGLGFFVTENADKKVLENKRNEFRDRSLPSFIEKMKMLDITIDEFISAYNKK